MVTVPTIIRVNDKNLKYHGQPLVVFLEEPIESAYFVRNPEYPIKKHSPKLFRIEKNKVEFAIRMKVLPSCKHCGKTMEVTNVEPYIHENYRITFHCEINQCGKDQKSIYFENVASGEF
jgi:hypothetical protein